MNQIRVIGISGPIGSGKSSVGNYLVKKYNFKEYSFAGALKESIVSLYNIPKKYVYGSQKDKEEIIPFWNINGRKMCQTVGTLFRDNIDKDFWIKRMHQEIIGNNEKKIVITDVRYPNELNYIINELKGDVLFITRDNLKYENYNHESEKYFEEFNKFETIKKINNNGSLDDLYNQIDNLL